MGFARVVKLSYHTRHQAYHTQLVIEGLPAMQASNVRRKTGGIDIPNMWTFYDTRISNLEDIRSSTLKKILGYHY